MTKKDEKNEKNSEQADGDQAILSTTQILNAIVNELVRSRLRNRALMNALMKSGHLNLADYLEAYREEEDANFNVLADLLLLPSAEFRARHEEWLNSEGARLGFLSGPRKTVHLTPSEAEAGDIRIPEAESGKGTARKRRAKK